MLAHSKFITHENKKRCWNKSWDILYSCDNWSNRDAKLRRRDGSLYSDRETNFLLGRCWCFSRFGGIFLLLRPARSKKHWLTTDSADDEQRGLPRVSIRRR